MNGALARVSVKRSRYLTLVWVIDPRRLKPEIGEDWFLSRRKIFCVSLRDCGHSIFGPLAHLGIPHQVCAPQPKNPERDFTIMLAESPSNHPKSIVIEGNLPICRDHSDPPEYKSRIYSRTVLREGSSSG